MNVTIKLKHYPFYLKQDKMSQADTASEKLIFKVTAQHNSYSIKLILA